MSNTIGIDELSNAISDELTLYNKNVIDKIKKQTQKSAKQLVKDTQDTAPVGRREKHYKDNIKAKKTYESSSKVEYTWYVASPDYRLSHLLEYGHASRNGGRVAGTGFIRKASDPILEDYVKKVEEAIQNG